MSLQIASPFQQFFDRDGSPLDNGFVYVGTANLNPETNPLTVYFDDALTIPAAQPLRTSNGYIVRNGSPARLYTSQEDFSLTVREKNNVLVYTVADATSLSNLQTQLASSSGSSLVGYNQGGTGAVTRTVQARLRDYVSVKDFGAVGDGVADDTVAIQAAVDAVASGGEIFFPPGTYRITTGIAKTYADGVSVALRGKGAKIDATGIGTFTAIELGGSRVSSTALGANVNKNSDTFTVSSAAGIAKGRILLISSTDLWNPTRPEYLKGELSLVEVISGTTITNYKPLYDGYTAATTTVHLLNMPQITVEGLEIECDDDVIALQILYARNPVVRDCKVHGSRYAGVYVGYNFGGTVDSNFIYDVWNGVVTGTSYGVIVGTGQGAKVVNNTISNARHAISNGGFEPCRDCVYANNVCHNSTLENLAGCIDTHGNSEFVVITGNIASSINCAGINTIIANNILNNAETNVPGILLFQEINSDYYIITGNKVTCAGATAYGVWVSPNVSGISIANLTFENNDVSSVLASIFIQPRNSGVTGCSTTTLALKNNTLKSTGNSAAFLLNVNGAATYSVTRFVSSGNVYDGVAHDAFACVSGNTIARTISNGDIFRANRNATSMATFIGVDVDLSDVIFEGNTGGAGNSRGPRYANSGRVTVTNPRFSNMTFKAELFTPTEYVENGWSAATPTILNTSGARLINFYGTLGRAITYGTAAPVANTWAVGDRVINQTPVVGQPKSWVCTVAGTPGTWVSEGNL